MITSTHVKDALYAGDALIEIRPKFPPAVARQGIVHSHGAGGFAFNALDSLGNQSELYKGIVESGRVMVAGDHGGDQWGNATAMARTTAEYNYLQGRPNVAPGKVALIGGSMGALNSLNWAAANRAKVSCVVGIIPVLDVVDFISRNAAGYGPAVTAAYGGSFTNAAQGAYNPAYNSATKYSGLPILLFYGLTDTLCAPAAVTAFKAAVGSSCTIVSVPTGHDYTSWSTVDRQMVADFIDTYAA